MIELKAGAMRERDFEPQFKLEHMLKDVRLALEEAQTAGTPFKSAAYAREVLDAAAEKGFGEQDFAALIEAFDQLSKRER